MDDVLARLTCKQALDTKENVIGEELCFCELSDKWENITLGDCFGNCESEESDNPHYLDQIKEELKRTVEAAKEPRIIRRIPKDEREKFRGAVERIERMLAMSTEHTHPQTKISGGKR